MKYQRAMAEVIRFDKNDEFMAASSGTIKALDDIIRPNCPPFYWTSDDGSAFYCKGYHGASSITINGYTYKYDQKGQSGKWHCGQFQ